MRCPALTLTLNLGLLVLFAAVLPAVESIAFPADAGIHDVKAEFGAKGDGVTDDTAAIQKAFKEIGSGHMRTLYFPNGTYLLSDTITFAEWIFVQGQSRDKTILRLKDACPGFTEAAKPRPLVCTLAGGGKGEGVMNMNFSTHLMNVTVDTGTGNPGAIAVEFMSHNGGGLEDVTIRSGDGAGVMGLDMRKGGQGPALCRRVSVEGFDVGLEIAASVFTSTFEDMVFRKQRVAVVRNSNHPVVMRKVRSENRVPFLVTSKPFEGTQFLLVDSELSGGDPAKPALDNSTKGQWGNLSLFLRNVTVTGWKSAADDLGREVTIAQAKDEYRSGACLTAFPSTERSLGLAVKETPALPWGDPARWTSVMKYNPIKLDATTRKPDDKLWDRPFEGHDATEALQQAIDSGATTVYLPYGSYLLRKPIILRKNIQVIQGCGSILMAAKDVPDGVLFRYEGSSAQAVFIDRLSCIGRIEHAAPKDLVILHCRWPGYQNAAPANGAALGKLFADDVCGWPWLFKEPQQAWLRSLNIESDHLKFDNTAASVWVLGYKTEGDGTEGRIGPKASLEILGGQFYCGRAPPLPMFTVEEGGRLSCTVTLFWSKEVLLQETRGGATKTVTVGKGTRVVDLLVAGAGKPER